MKIDFTKVLVGLDGEAIKKKGDSPFTLADAACEGVLIEPESTKLTGQEKSQRYALAVKIYGHSGLPLELTPEEVVLIREGIAKAYAPLIAGQAWAMFDEQDKENDKKKK